ncbi:MarR family winged helix-turn-helix transcriptional regulator [Saccharopolyspora sp. MS10]|uniref:MarR family winged helix-turn-helix transcriptional regulator n=1 Tax=Saccharopolyspora sp. MS10 TaxID=3385973 RepID=UPI0039A21C0B
MPAEMITELDAAAQALFVVWGLSAERARPKVSASQLRALLVVEQRGTVSLTELADEIGAIPSAASRLCDRLQAAGWLVRGTGESDRRAISLRLTPDGARLLDGLRQERRTDLNAVLTGMSARHRAQLLSGLSAFRAAAEHPVQRFETA